jgi:hypothetical protein
MCVRRHGALHFAALVASFLGTFISSTKGKSFEIGEAGLRRTTTQMCEPKNLSILRKNKIALEEQLQS